MQDPYKQTSKFPNINQANQKKKKSKIFNKKINKYWGKETENAKQEAANKTNKQQSDKQCVWLCIVSKIKKWRGKSTFL